MNSALWIIVIGFPVLLSCFVLSTVASPSNNQRIQKVNATNELRVRKETKPDAVEPTNNFGIKFVPLFSLIATFIPKLLRRFGNFTKTTSSRHEARMSRMINNLQIDGFNCSPENFGIWKYPNDIRQFYVCRGNTDVSECLHRTVQEQKVIFHNCGQVEIKSMGCVSLEINRCIQGYVFSEQTKQCRPLIETTKSTPEIFHLQNI